MGAGLCRYLNDRGVSKVVEVDRPNRQDRRRRGKSDTIDAEAAARAALNGTATGVPKTRDGDVEAIRALRVVRRSMRCSAVVKGLHQLRGVVFDKGTARCPRSASGPQPQRPPEDVCARMRGQRRGHANDGDETNIALSGTRPPDQHPRGRARPPRRHNSRRLLLEQCPELLELRGVGPDTARRSCWSRPATTANGSDSEASFAETRAALCRSKRHRVVSDSHRLNRGGDRQANHALWRIVLVRMHCDHAYPRNTSHRRRSEALSTQKRSCAA